MIDDDNRRLVDEAAAASTSRSPVFVTDADIIPTTDLWDGTHPKTRGEQKIAAGFVDAFASDLGIGTSCPRAYHAVPMGPRTSPVLSVQPGVGQARLTWTTAPGATGYDVYLTNITRPDASFTKLPFPVAGFVLDRRWAG